MVLSHKIITVKPFVSFVEAITSNILFSFPVQHQSINLPNPFRPTEKTWTYKCENDKCVRYHYLTETNGEKRVPFMTCSMTCGDVNVWPHPTKRVGVLSSSLRFSVESLQLKISTSFQEVERLYRKSFQVFLKELKQIQKVEFFDHGKVAENVDKINPSEDTMSNKPSKCQKSHCDITNFIVEVHIVKSGRVYIDLDTDESYNLTSTCKFFWCFRLIVSKKYPFPADNNNLVAKITANTFFGARHALSTLQQLIWYDEEDDLLRILSRFVISDAPKFK